MKPPLLLPHLLLVLFVAALAAPSSALPLQLLALVSLRSSLVDPSSNLRDWSYRSVDSGEPDATPPPWCSWSGVTCDASTGEVTALDLSRRNLSGSLPSEIRLLSRSLVRLNLSSNSLEGPLPTALFDLRNLEALDISHNDINSTFPQGISRLRYLAVFDAYSNSFTGPVPLGVTRLRRLQHLNLGGSFFQGWIPAGLGGLQELRYLHLAGNLLNGSLPRQLGLLPRLEHLEIGYNQFEGGVPAEFGGLPRLVYLDISSANLSGALPSELGNLSQLGSLFLFKNRFTGRIPDAYAQLRALQVLDLSDNRLSGPIPPGLSSLSNLTLLSLMNNELSGEVPSGIGELPNLETLLLWNNSLTGALPPALGANGRLVKLDVSSNSFTGPVPPDLCWGNRLARLILFSNRFELAFPLGLANCTSLWRLRIESNRFSGPIPTGFGLLPNLTYMDLSSNNFSGGLPGDLGNATRLELLNVSGNPLGGVLPATIWRAPSLQIFSASRCGLAGEIPAFEFGCKSLYKVELDGNALAGSIPWDVGHCQRLLSLKLDLNRLTGIIPWELAALPSITDVDLAINSLSGSIPSSFDNCTTLESFNVSFNHLTGPVPSSGSVFRNLQPSSFQGNDGLCGAVVSRPCLSEHAQGFGFQRDPDAPTARKPSGAAIVWISAAAFGVGLVVLLAGTRCFQGRQLGGEEKDHDQGQGPWKLTAFQRLNFTVEDVAECISTGENIIGMGSTGTVYRAEMPGGEVIAVKKLWGKQKEAAMMMPARVRRRGGVLAEVEVLGSVRHRNIVRLLGCCSNRETTLLLYEYMPNGSLEDLLHRRPSGNGGKGERDMATAADWSTRYKIAMGVAQGICYLHHDCDPVIVHRDLKPSNILLDADMEARVADFGVAKLIQTGNESMSVIAGSYGYIAPEYAYTLQVDEKSDIYSYGVLLMELLSGRRSVESAFGEGNSIVDWVRSKVAAAAAGGTKSKEARAGPWEVLDAAAGAGCPRVRERMMLVLRVALLCTSRNPADRPSMRDVVSMLREAKPSEHKVAAQPHPGAVAALPPSHSKDNTVDP
ncbi:hypothetical protein Taro_051198 [Colocasia esculenta]|uniref:non-specific serine/threonine protein kinase n=1 Tax=Colocasia esculenta TaxID=4460 RepID=A0A843XG58_COLES|nr:hypothetical protein [Colocasia esculenta]